MTLRKSSEQKHKIEENPTQISAPKKSNFLNRHALVASAIVGLTAAVPFSLKFVDFRSKDNPSLTEQSRMNPGDPLLKTTENFTKRFSDYISYLAEQTDPTVSYQGLCFLADTLAEKKAELATIRKNAGGNSKRIAHSDYLNACGELLTAADTIIKAEIARPTYHNFGRADKETEPYLRQYFKLLPAQNLLDAVVFQPSIEQSNQRTDAFLEMDRILKKEKMLAVDK